MARVISSQWIHLKPEFRASLGMVVARHPVAAEAGAEILRKGGNAADAAVAASLANGVVQPFATTIGGGGIAVVHRNHETPQFIDYRYEAPAGVTPAMFLSDEPFELGIAGWRGASDANEHGPLSVGVPGSVAGLISLHRRHGRLPLVDVVRPSSDLARSGYETDWYQSLMQGSYLTDLLSHEETARLFLNHGVPYRPMILEPADRHVQPSLADALDEIVATEGTSMYHGAISESILEQVGRPFGVMSGEDLAGYKPRESEARLVEYRSRFVAMGMHASIGPLLMRILAGIDMPKYDADSAQRYHLLIEALRFCRYVETNFLGETDEAFQVVSELEKSGAIDELAGQIRVGDRMNDWRGILPDRFALDGSASDTLKRSEGTANICAVDDDGMCVALTETILGPYGSMISTRSGILLNNAMFAFDPRPGLPNSIGSKRRPISNMTPVIVYGADGRNQLCLGASGGRRISSTVAQILSLVLDHGVSLQEAIQFPRVDVAGNVVLADSRLSPKVMEQLSSWGHDLQVHSETLSSMIFANPGGIMIGSDGALVSGLNPLQSTAAAGASQ